jgi:hypothetical protein
MTDAVVDPSTPAVTPAPTDTAPPVVVETEPTAVPVEAPAPVASTDEPAPSAPTHESLLRRLVETLDRDFNMFTGELKAMVDAAKSHLGM